MKRAASEHVYVARGPSGRNKIGIAADPTKRLEFLRSDGAVEMVRTWHRPRDARAVEYAARSILVEHRALRFEWFSVPVERCIEAVESAIEMVEAGTAPVSPRIQTRMNREKHNKWWLDWRTEFDRLNNELEAWIAADPANATEFEATMKKLKDK